MVDATPVEEHVMSGKLWEDFCDANGRRRHMSE
jgi:hypothetical protein